MLENKENLNINQSFESGTPVLAKAKVLLPPISRIPSVVKYRP